ncbi:hypothetical protein AEST_02860 [Alishewanella aestuarii B11]|uniref:Uncharacterized protein n=1 Tax=Alishewanella aestuarii B11 TaxID=1197174 RepID=J1YFK0_9ALTE|nr:hypothetical protein AEST_02860 [Alishewanella aestuarii B11]
MNGLLWRDNKKAKNLHLFNNKIKFNLTQLAGSNNVTGHYF